MERTFAYRTAIKRDLDPGMELAIEGNYDPNSQQWMGTDVAVAAYVNTPNAYTTNSWVNKCVQKSPLSPMMCIQWQSQIESKPDSQQDQT